MATMIETPKDFTDSICQNHPSIPDEECYDDYSTSSSSSCSGLSVSFSSSIVVREVLHIYDYTPEEIHSTWYSPEDIRSWKTTTRLMAKNEMTADCERGLENRSPEGAKQKRQNKRNARMAVLLEQVNQRREGYYDADAIADAYYESNEHCQVAANMIALRDEKEARIILSEDTKYLSSSFQLKPLISCMDKPKVVANSAA